MKVVVPILIAVAALALTACDLLQSPTPTFSETLKSDLATLRQDLSSDVVVAFVEGLTPEVPGKVAYITHVTSGSQAVLNIDGKLTHRYDGRGDGRGHLDAILGDADAMSRIKGGLTSGEDLRPQAHTITWVPLFQFGGIKFVKLRNITEPAYVTDGRGLSMDDLGPVLYRIAFRGNGYVGPGYNLQDGDATYLNPGTEVYTVIGYSEQFRLATVEDGRVVLYEADSNPLAETGADLLDIHGKVSAIDILDDTDEMTVISTIQEEQAIHKFVKVLLAAPVDQGIRKHDGQRYFLRLRLADGTSVVRAFWLETGELSRGILAGPAAVAIVTDAVRNG